MGWKVVATQNGLHNNIFREIGEVFDLRTYPDGTYPPLIVYTEKKDKSGKVIEDEYDEKITETMSLDGKKREPSHRDFAEDKGNIAIRKGPKKGEVMRFGWMKRVPDNVPIGIYPAPDGKVPDFWSNTMLPAPFQREFIAEDRRRNHAPIDHARYLTKESAEEEAAA
jgi:hypothetical protein